MMKKLRGILAAILLLWILSLVFSAEYTGTIGPDINSQSGFSGNVDINSLAQQSSLGSCNVDANCSTNNCSVDFDGDSKACAAATSCVNDGVLYATGSKICDGSLLGTCTNGIWSSQTCSLGCSNGACSVGGGGGSSGGSGTSGTTSGGSSGGGGGGGGGSSTSTGSTKDTIEIITQTSGNYTPTIDDVKSLLEESLTISGTSSEQEIQNALTESEKLQELIDLGEITVINELKVEKTTSGNTATYKSTLTVKFSNNSNKTLKNIEIVIEIPKNIALKASQISSPLNFEVLIDDPVIKYKVSELSPGQVSEFPYSVDKQVNEEDGDKVKVAYFAEEVEDFVPEPEANKLPISTFTATPLNGTAPLTVQFDATASRDPDGTIESFNWDFGNGVNGTGVTAKNTFENKGTYKVRLLVRDNKNGTGTSTQTITVTEDIIADDTNKEEPIIKPEVEDDKPIDFTPIILIIIILIVAYFLWKTKGKEKPESKDSPLLKPVKDNERHHKTNHHKSRRWDSKQHPYEKTNLQQIEKDFKEYDK